MDIPKPNDRTEWSKLTIGNWAGKGSAENCLYKTRPVDCLDFCAKLHDFLFVCNSLTISDAPYDNNQIKKSHLAKSNYIFWLLVNKVKEKSLGKLAVDIIGGAILTYDEKDFLSDDGFQNVLAADDLQSPEFLIIPFDQLPAKTQKQLTKIVYDDSFDGIGQSGGMKKRVYDYDTATTFDITDWRTWAEEYFCEAWEKAFAVE